MNVCHSCDKRACYNPKHLWVGTQRDNILDAQKKNKLKLHLVKKRSDRRGEKHHLSKLKEEDVLNIRKLLSEKYKQTEIAKIYGLDPSTVSNIKTRKLWPHI
jgi:DNA invertase Pin-like site-specific DNA recombinase